MNAEDPKIERLWAPWRLEHIRKAGQKSTDAHDCVFCELAPHKCAVDNLKLYQGQHCFVVMNRFPYNPNHLLVIPNEHVALTSEMSASAWAEFSLVLKAATDLLMERVKPHGMNMGLNIGKAGGASIAGHLHFHILPRWEGDTNFMPILAEAKSIPVHNIAVYQSLETLFADFDKFLKRP